MAERDRDKIEFFESLANYQPLDDFLGLSPDQMHQILYFPLDELKNIIWFNDGFDPTLLEQAPVVTKTKLLIKFLGDLGKAKATKNSYLPKKIVNILHESPMENHTVQTEENALDVLALRYAVTDCGWMKKKSGYFSLTKKGQHIFDKGFTTSDYLILLKYWIKKYNWSFSDRFPLCPLIQKASIFLLYLLNRKAAELVPAQNFIQLFIRAFPTALEEVSSESLKFKLNTPPEEEIGWIIRIRFLQRFVKYFGLADYIIDEKLSHFDRDEQAQIKTTELFTAVFGFFSPEKVNLLRQVDTKFPH